MAVQRVIGTVDGTEVILTHTEGDRWQVPVPVAEDGEYVVEIMAEDTVGNRSYIAKMLFTISKALLIVKMVNFPYYAKLLPLNYFAEIIGKRRDEMQGLMFDAGEKRRVKFAVRALNEEPFKVRNAKYELSLLGEVVQSGDCDIEENNLSCLVSVSEKNTTYLLKVTYEVADEVLIETINISTT